MDVISAFGNWLLTVPVRVIIVSTVVIDRAALAGIDLASTQKLIQDNITIRVAGT